MRIQIQFQLPAQTLIPYNYQYPLTSWLYRCIDTVQPDLGDWLHKEGIRHNKRNYKPLLFSRLYFQERVIKKREGMLAKGSGYWYIDSMKDELIHAIIKGGWQLGAIALVNKSFPIVNMNMLPQPDWNSSETFQTLSPIVVPIRKQEKLYYCHPLQSQFYDSLRNALYQWFEIYWGTPPKEADRSLSMTLLHPEQFNLRKAADLTEFKGKKIKAYHLKFQLEGSQAMKEVAYHTGIGSYGSQGFGMIDTWKPQ